VVPLQEGNKFNNQQIVLVPN